VHILPVPVVPVAVATAVAAAPVLDTQTPN
jgi:hypothetical protein